MPKGPTGRPRGRPKGARNKASVERERGMQAIKAAAFAELTPEQINALMPKDVLRLCTLAAIRAGDAKMALDAAAKWAPYEHATKTESTVTLTPIDVRRLADLARSEAARRGIDFESADGPAAGALPN